MSTDTSLLPEVALTLLPGIGPLITRQLISYMGSAQAVLSAPPGKLQKVPGVGRVTVENLKNNAPAALRRAEDVLRQAEKTGTRLLYYTRPDYPARLRPVPDAPVLLYYQGTADLNAPRTLAVVGTRNASDYGRDQTERLVRDAAPYQPLIVSGLAYGIDIAAHRAALQEGLPTIGVMATGIDSIYPHAHRRTAEKMLEQGGLLTEFTFGTPPDKFNFPARNRIIAGLADGTVVVEAARKGGALITAELALDYNREVLAVPGNLGQPTSEGCNYLIRSSQASMYTGPNDLVVTLNWDNALQRAPTPAALDPADFTPEEFRLLQILAAQGEQQIDELSWQAQLPVHQVLSLLLGLEFRGLVRALPGKKFGLS